MHIVGNGKSFCPECQVLHGECFLAYFIIAEITIWVNENIVWIVIEIVSLLLFSRIYRERTKM